MGYVRLRIRELAEQKGWTLKQVADRSQNVYSRQNVIASFSGTT